MTEAEKIAITKYDLYYESRMTKVESAILNIDKEFQRVNSDIKEIKFDLRWMLGIWITINGVMFAMMAHGFHWY